MRRRVGPVVVAAARLHKVERGDHLIVPRPFPVLVRLEIIAVGAERAVELDLHVVLPLPGQARGTHDQHPPKIARAFQRGEQQADLDRLAQPDIVRDDPVRAARRDDPVDELDLCGRRIDVEPVERAGRLVPRPRRVAREAHREALTRIGVRGLRAQESEVRTHDPAKTEARQPQQTPVRLQLHQCLVQPRQTADGAHPPHP